MMSIGTPNTRTLLEAVDATDVMQEWERRKARTAWWMAGWDRAWSRHLHREIDASFSWFGRKNAVRIERLLILRAKTRWFRAYRRAQSDALEMGSAIRERQASTK